MLGVPQPNANSMSSANYKDVSFLLHLGGGVVLENVQPETIFMVF